MKVAGINFNLDALKGITEEEFVEKFKVKNAKGIYALLKEHLDLPKPKRKKKKTPVEKVEDKLDQLGDDLVLKDG